MRHNLKYFFVAYYKDGTKYEQNVLDVSVKDPQKSCFFDVDVSNVVLFTLTSPSRGFYSVDLTTGKFQANDRSWFAVHDENEPLSEKKLKYFRRVTKDFSSTGKEVSESIVYHIGWEAVRLSDNEPVTYTLAIV